MKWQTWPPTARWLLEVVMLAGGYFAAAQFGLSMAFAGTNVSPIWPPAGIALAVILLLGYRVWPGIWLGAFLVQVTAFAARDVSGATAILTSSAISVGNTLAVLAGAFLIRRFGGKRHPFERIQDTFKFIAFGVLLAPVLSATLEVASLLASGLALVSMAGYLWWVCWLGGAMGVLTITPLILVAFNQGRPYWSWLRWFEAAILLGLLAVVSLVIFKESGGPVRYHPEYLLIPLMVWITFRFGQRGATLSTFVLAGITVWCTAANSGPFVMESTNDSLLVLQTFLAITGGMVLVLASVLTERDDTEAELRLHQTYLEEMVHERTLELTQSNAQLAQEIGERRRAEGVLRQSEERFKGLVERSFDVVAVVDMAGCLTYVSPAVARIGNYAPEDMVGHHFLGFFSKSDQTKAQQGFDRVIQGESVAGLRLETMGKGGAIAIVEMNGAPIYKNGQIVGAQVVYRDITPHLNIEESLRRERDLLGRIMETSPLGIVTLDRAGQIVFANSKAEKVLGLTKAKITDRTYNDPAWRITDYEGNPFPNQKLPFQQVLTTGQVVYDVRHAIEWPDGRRMLLSINAAPLLDETGEIGQVVSTIDNVTERIQAERTMQESQQMLQLIMDSIPQYVFRKDIDLVYQWCNLNFARMAGVETPANIVGKTDYDLVWKEEAATYRADDHEVADNNRAKLHVIEPRRQADGTQVWLDMNKIPLHDESGNVVGLLGMFEDITERRQSAEALSQRNRELAMLNEASRALSSSLDLDGVLKKLVEQVHRLPDVLGCSVWLVDPETNELVCREVTDPQRQIVQGWRLPPGEGLAGWVVEHKQSLNVPDVLADERHFKGVDRETRLELRSVLTVPLQMKQKVLGVMQIVDEKVACFDETHQTLLESLAATAAIAIQNALWYEQARQDAETKLALFHEVNHRVKNNLTAIIGLLYAERRHATMEGRSYRDIINTLINRIQGLATVHELLSAVEWRPLPLSVLAKQVINAALQVSSMQHVSVDISPSPVEVSPTQANQLALIINELTTNAMKYAFPQREKGIILVKIVADDGLVHFEFRDDGPGYPADVLRFERHNVGLYLIQTMVQSGLQGTLKLYNEGGAITVIEFKLQ